MIVGKNQITIREVTDGVSITLFGCFEYERLATNIAQNDETSIWYRNKGQSVTIEAS